MYELYIIGISLTCIITAFLLYAIFGGVHDTLSNAKPGNVYSFDYLQPNSGEPHRHIVKVIGVQKLNDEEIRRLDRQSKYRETDPNFRRSETLVKTVDTDGRYRQFYAERAVATHWLPFGGLRFRAGV